MKKVIIIHYSGNGTDLIVTHAQGPTAGKWEEPSLITIFDRTYASGKFSELKIEDTEQAILLRDALSTAISILTNKKV